jgi:hypothetical protein
MPHIWIYSSYFQNNQKMKIEPDKAVRLAGHFKRCKESDTITNRMKTNFAIALTLLMVACGKPSAPISPHAESVEIIKGIVQRDTVHPIHDDRAVVLDKSAASESKRAALERLTENRTAFKRLREVIEVGRPLHDYAPIERLGRYIGENPNRFFLTGFLGDIKDQGAEPFSIKIDIDERGIITKVTQLVASQ